MYIEVNLNEQRLTAFDQTGEVVINTLVSTARNGSGETENSFCTPRGWHRIRAKIGKDAPRNTVFKARRPTGELFSEELRNRFPDRDDWILTRILWLCGLEPGFNRFGNVETMHRYIYIHGCPDGDPMGVPSSHGCIKMRNEDVIELFAQTDPGAIVYIKEGTAL